MLSSISAEWLNEVVCVCHHFEFISVNLLETSVKVSL